MAGSSSAGSSFSINVSTSGGSASTSSLRPTLSAVLGSTAAGMISCIRSTSVHNCSSPKVSNRKISRPPGGAASTGVPNQPSARVRAPSSTMEIAATFGVESSDCFMGGPPWGRVKIRKIYLSYFAPLPARITSCLRSIRLRVFPHLMQVKDLTGGVRRVSSSTRSTSTSSSATPPATSFSKLRTWWMWRDRHPRATTREGRSHVGEIGVAGGVDRRGNERQRRSSAESQVEPRIGNER